MKLGAQGQGSQGSAQKNVRVLAKACLGAQRTIGGEKQPKGLRACQVGPGIFSQLFGTQGPWRGQEEPGLVVPMGRRPGPGGTWGTRWALRWSWLKLSSPRRASLLKNDDGDLLSEIPRE